MRRCLRALVISGLLATCVATVGAAQELARHTMPVVVKSVQPQYTQEAREARVQGIVVLDVVVSKDGSVGDVTVSKSLDQKYGLDEQAVKAVKQWEFKPGTRDGKPVDVRVAIEMSFALR
jgi:protein TonB